METVRMSGLIDSLLILARADAGTEALRFEWVDANRLALDMGEKWKTALRLALLDFRVDTAPDQPLVRADGNALQRLLTILLDNAARYTPTWGDGDAPGGAPGRARAFHPCTIRELASLRSIRRAYLIVSTAWSALWGPASRGSGLGLALAKWLAEKHGTTLSLESVIGQGSCFGFALPSLSGAACIALRCRGVPRQQGLSEHPWLSARE